MKSAVEPSELPQLPNVGRFHPSSFRLSLNSPYKFTDPLGLLSESTGACGNRCPGSDGGSGGSFDSAVSGGFVGENETVTIDLDIVYDSSQFSRPEAIQAMQDSVQHLQSTFSAINVTFNITYTAGTADTVSRQNSECAGCAYSIRSGAVDGAINVFLHNNSRNLLQTVSYFRPENSQIFIEKAGSVPKEKLAHEVGHLLRFLVNGPPGGGIPLLTHTGAGWRLVGSTNHSEDGVIDDANARMRQGPLAYGSQYVDDYRTVAYSQVTPGRTANILGDLAPRHMVARTPTAYDIYRLGARIVSGQKR